MNREQLLAELKVLQSISQRMYILYIQSGSIYLFAKGLYKINTKIVSCLESLIKVDSKIEIDKIGSLLIHYTNWMTQFELLEKKNNPDQTSEFVFHRVEGDIPFNKDYIEELLSKS